MFSVYILKLSVVCSCIQLFIPDLYAHLQYECVKIGNKKLNTTTHYSNKSCKVSKNTTLYTLFLYFYPMTNETTFHTPWVTISNSTNLLPKAPPSSLCMNGHPPLPIARHCTQSIKPTYLMTTVGLQKAYWR